MGPVPDFQEDNVQGDILYGLPKDTETFVFFQLIDANAFQKRLPALLPSITTSAKVKEGRAIFKQNKLDPSDGSPDDKAIVQWSGVNIAFTSKGLTKMGLKQDRKSNDVNDDEFRDGMTEDKATVLGDNFADWQSPFQQKDCPIDGLILIAGDSRATTDAKQKMIERILGMNIGHPTALTVTRIVGDVRPEQDGKRGFEHFGFRDGVSQPVIDGIKDFKGIVDAKGVKRVSKDPKAPPTVELGKFLLGRDGDIDFSGNKSTRPSWAIDGSFLCFRYLFQKVPEFNSFLKKNMPQNTELLASQLMGRWKSGAPVDLTPEKDNPQLAQSNLFTYHKDAQEDVGFARCPLGAHTRKTNPRGDLPFVPGAQPAPMLRRGIPFGPELSSDETDKTKRDRGLIFVSYQSSIGQSFETIQRTWANNFEFPVRGSGIDPFIATARVFNRPNPEMGVMKSANQRINVPHEDWVVAKGGEYFFSPSMKALSETLALPASRVNGA